MENDINLIDKLLKFAHGSVYGISSVVIGLLFSTIALILFPNYNFLLNMISELGVGPGGIFFNLGLILAGILAIPFFIYFGRVLRSNNTSDSLEKSAVITSIISCVSFSLIGCFPSIQNNNIILFFHGTFTLINWICEILYLTFFSILILKNSKFLKLQAFHGFIGIGIIIFNLFTWWPITEWAVAFIITSWILVNAMYILYKKI